MQMLSNAKLNKKGPRTALFDTTLATQPIPIKIPAKNPFLIKQLFIMKTKLKIIYFIRSLVTMLDDTRCGLDASSLHRDSSMVNYKAKKIRLLSCHRDTSKTEF